MEQSNSVDNEKRATSSPHSRVALSKKAPLSSPHATERYNIAKVSSVYDLAALDGLKGAASFVVMAFHALMYWGSILDLQKGYKVSDKYIV
jgi:hypothetical protein